MAVQRGNCSCGGVYCIRGGRLLCQACGREAPIPTDQLISHSHPGTEQKPHQHIDPQAEKDNNVKLRANMAEAEKLLCEAWVVITKNGKNVPGNLPWLKLTKGILIDCGLIDKNGAKVETEPEAVPV